MTALDTMLRQGRALHQQGRLDDAVRLYQAILHQQPRHPDALHLLGIAALQAGQPEQGVHLIREAIALRPTDAAMHLNIGNGLRDLGRFDAALASYDTAIALRPHDAEAHHNRGAALLDLRRPEAALASYDRALALNPGHAAAHNGRGNALLAVGSPEAAIASFDRAIALRPDFAEGHYNRGNALARARRFAEALASHDTAIALNPNLAEAHSGRGEALWQLNQPAAALLSFDMAIRLKPDYAPAHCNRGIALMTLLRLDEAAASFRRALAAQLDYAEAHWNDGLRLLLTGRFEPGWRGYEWRAKLAVVSADRPYARPLWRGDHDIAGKVLFVYWEQGLGDTIMFCRYARLAAERGAIVILRVQDPLYRLCRQLSPTIQVIRASERPAAFDYHCPLPDLPLAFGTTLETIPAISRYLGPDTAAHAKWSARLGDLLPAGKPKIGIAWRGNPCHPRDQTRSMDLLTCLPLFACDAAWVCLQKEMPDADAETAARAGSLIFVGDELDDFSDTAALIDLLDLVITVDTSVAHLAGAMGKPVWILLPYSPDWRWLLDRDDSPWYPSAKLFRQPTFGDWRGVIARVADALRGPLAPAPP